MSKLGTCVKCGAEVGAETASGLCASCQGEVQTVGAGGTTTSSTVVLSPAEVLGGKPVVSAPAPAQLPAPGDIFGDYQIERRMGEGGMGAVYEAVHLGSQRRLALKVLSHSLDSAEARERFLQEGRLAALVNNPHSVYVYGTEEIEGMPVISMELVSGGTLVGWVQESGPLPVYQAVDLILQVIEGLEAAQAFGVLHRDIKPSNCFLSGDGSVKIGDFGLSISALARSDTEVFTPGAFLGTPAFSSPEQLKGEELDVRSDVYSVGVTLYYLLTGRTPFQSENLVELLATVLERAPQSPDRLRKEVPRGLARVILRCLAKQPARRYRDYGELRQALLPFTSAAPSPAALGVRFAAGFLDFAVLALTAMVPALLWLYDLGPHPGWIVLDPSEPFFVEFLGLSWRLLYFAVPEWLWGASLGKAAFRLRVVDAQRHSPPLPWTLWRTVLFVVLPEIPHLLYLASEPVGWSARPTGWQAAAVSSSWVLLTLLMFVVARRANGFAALHDLLSRTQVVSRSARPVRPSSGGQLEPLPRTEAEPSLGPYAILGTLSQTPGEELLLGYDPRLLRRVWIRRLSGEGVAVQAETPTPDRRGRLRWVNGRRSEVECWDAYEAPSGKPLLSYLSEPQPWLVVRFWLVDLAEELCAGLKEGDLPPMLGLDRVWITADGRARLLDFPAPGVEAHEGVRADSESAQVFLRQVAFAGLEGRVFDPAEAAERSPALPLPWHVRCFLDELPSADPPPKLIRRFRALLHGLPFVSGPRRLALLTGCGLPVFLTAAAVFFGTTFQRRLVEKYPDVESLRFLLTRLDRLENQGGLLDRQTWLERRSLEIYVAGQYRSTITNASTWSGFYARTIMPDSIRRRAEGIMELRAPPTRRELAEAKSVLLPLLDRLEMRRSRLNYGLLVRLRAAMDSGATAGFLVVVVPSLLASLLVRRGLLLRVLGIELVTREGAAAGRGRLFLRGLVGWLPVLAVPLVLGLPGGVWLAAFLLGVFVAGAVVAVARPDQGLHDRFLGTWLVPR